MVSSARLGYCGVFWTRHVTITVPLESRVTVVGAGGGVNYPKVASHPAGVATLLVATETGTSSGSVDRSGPSADFIFIFWYNYSLQEEKASNKTEEANKDKTEEKKPSKPVTVREQLEMALQWLDIADTTEDTLSTSVKKYD